jgi:hypothetical protein
MYGLIRQTLSDRMSTVNGDCLEFRRLLCRCAALLGACSFIIHNLDFIRLFLLSDWHRHCSMPRPLMGKMFITTEGGR